MTAPTEGSAPPELAAASEHELELAGTPASVALAMPASSQRLLESTAVEGAGRALVSIEDIEAERDPGLGYAVYLDAAGEPEPSADRARRHIGNISFFGIEKLNDPDEPHEGGPLRYTFDASDALSTLAEQGGFDPASVRVSFEPIEVLPPPGEELVEVERLEDVTPVRIGRVSLFLA